MESICEDTVVSEEKYNNFIPILRSGEWSDIGHRPYMEDTHICIPDLARNFNSKLLGEESISFYGVRKVNRKLNSSVIFCEDLTDQTQGEPRFLLPGRFFGYLST